MRILSPRMFHRTDGVLITGFLPFLQFILRHDNYVLKLAKMGFIDPSHIKSSKPINEGNDSQQNDAYYMDLAMEATGVFLRKVLQPQPWIEERVENVLRPFREKYLIGMQIRMGKGGGTFKDTHTFLESKNILQFSQQANLHREKINLPLNQTRWVVCTDADQAEDKLREEYGEVIVVSKDFHRGHSKTGAKDPDGFSRAVIDLLLLSRCDYQILTSHSTFSVIARTMRKEGASFYMMPSRGY